MKNIKRQIKDYISSVKIKIKKNKEQIITIFLIILIFGYILGFFKPHQYLVVFFAKIFVILYSFFLELINFNAREFLNKWQTLIGSALGPFLLGVGFWLKEIRKEKKERKEFLRRIEISVSRSLDNVYKTRQKLQDFALRLRELAIRIRDKTDEYYFSLDSTNYPTIKDVYRDIEMPNFKMKSYYLHNKLLWIDAGAKETNVMISGFRNDFTELLRKNEILIVLMKQNKNPNPAEQRKQYAKNLESFADSIDGFINKFIEQSIEIMVSVKIYNDCLRKRSGFLFLWKNEGTKFKYFYNKKEQKEFSRNLDSIDRIDKVIQKEVQESLREAEERIAGSSQ